MKRNRKYVLDLSDLQYKLVRLPLKIKILRSLFWFTLSLMIAAFYGYLFQKQFGSPKEEMLSQQIESMRLKFSLLDMEMNNAVSDLKSFQQSDEIRYRPVLSMDSVPLSIRRAGFGGVERFSDLRGYENSDLIISVRTHVEEIKNMAKVQEESFSSIKEKSVEWRRQLDHFPGISPVSVEYRLGDRYMFRSIHPVLGTPRMHNGQDFEVPYGTEVYATGDGVIAECGYNWGGFGNYIVIDHDYGLASLYGHLSEIRVVKGMNVKRGDLIGISGNTGLTTGPHLHYQIEDKGISENPLRFFNNDMTLEEYKEMIQAFEAKSRFR